MVYTETQLIELRDTAVVPTRVDFEAFTKSIEEQRLIQEQQHTEEEVSGRRRSSVHGSRPIFRGSRMKPREKVVPQADNDGWFTYSKKKQGSVSGEDATQSRDEFRTVTKSSQVKVRPNNKNISSSRPADARDITADKPKTAFNAFSALDSEEDSDEE